MAFPQAIQFSGENSPGFEIHDWDAVHALLSELNTDGRSFFCFEKPDGSYFQCAGSQVRVTAEARISSARAHFQHFVFGRGSLADREEKIPTTEFQVTVDSSQVLQIQDVRVLLRPWLEGGSFPDTYTMTDITARFLGSD